MKIQSRIYRVKQEAITNNVIIRTHGIKEQTEWCSQRATTYLGNAPTRGTHLLQVWHGDTHRVSAMMEIDDHALYCGGKLCHDSKRDVHYAGLCGRIRMSCGKGGGRLTGRFIYMNQTYIDNYRLHINRHARCGGTEFTHCSTVGGGNLAINSDR